MTGSKFPLELELDYSDSGSESLPKNQELMFLDGVDKVTRVKS